MSTGAKRGFTLIEMMVVLIIVAISMTGVALSIGATGRANLRTSCFTLTAAVQYAYSNAVTSGLNTRLVLDLDNNTFHLESTPGRVVLNREDETGEGLRSEAGLEGAGPKSKGLLNSQMNSIGESVGAGEASALDTGMNTGTTGVVGMMGLAGGAGAGDMSSFMDGAAGRLTDPFLLMMQQGGASGLVGYQRPKFSPIAGKRGQVRELKGDTAFVVVHAPHQPEPREEGKAFIYFFPGGVTEHAIVQLSDGADKIYSIEVHPLSGRAEIHMEAIEPKEDLDDLQEAEE